MDTSGITIVAWWGAILSTVVLVWDVYKWRTSGPKLRVAVLTGMEGIDIPGYEGEALISVNVTNYGDRPTTITSVGFKFYRTAWARIRNKPETFFVLAYPNKAQPLPFELKQGNFWSGTAGEGETTDIRMMADSGHLICELYHSHREKPVRRRVVIRSRDW